jgi:hypothetical protein
MPASAPLEEPSTLIRYSIGRNRFDAHPAQREAESFDEFEQTVLSTRAAIKGLFYVAAAFDSDHTGKPHRGREHALPTHFLCFDFDGIPGQDAFAELCMFLSGYRGFGYTTASHTPEAPRARAILAADREMTREERMRLSAYLEQCIAMKVPGIKFDSSVYRAEQPCFTPVFESQEFTWHGEPINVDALLRFAPQVKAETTSTSANLIKIESTDPVLSKLKERGMIKRDLGGGRFGVVCPCESDHSGPSESESATVYTLPKFNGFDFGNFTCLHNHCEHRPQSQFLEALGLGHKETRLEQAKVPADHSELISNLTAKVEQQKVEQQEQELEAVGSLLGSYDYDIEHLRPVEFVIDGYLANKVTVIAGPPGVGKTSLLVPLAAHAAHLCPTTSDLRPVLRRRVAYITEDPGQVERILYGMRKHGVINASASDFKFWFDVIPARRVPAHMVANMVENIREEKTVTAGKALNDYRVEPLIILDTSNATIDLDNENDNSEAGKAIAAIKEVLGDAALWVVAHTSKVASRDDIAQMSARGAGAFEGDANAVSYIINVENTRFMVLGKRRFEADFTELKFESHAHFEEVIAPWGQPQKVWYRYGVPLIAEADEREQIKAQAKENAENMSRLTMRGKINSILLSASKTGSKVKKDELKKLVGGKSQTVGNEIDTMVVEGLIVQEVGPRNAKFLSLPKSKWEQVGGNN